MRYFNQNSDWISCRDILDLCCWPSTPSNILRLRIGSQCNATSNLRDKWKYDIVKNYSEILDISSIWWRSNHSGPRGSKIFENYLHCLNHPHTQPQTKASSNLMKKQVWNSKKMGEASWYQDIHCTSESRLSREGFTKVVLVNFTWRIKLNGNHISSTLLESASQKNTGWYHIERNPVNQNQP